MAAPTLAQSKVTRLTSANTTLALTFDSNVVSGAYIVVFAATSTNYSGLSISDNQANSYTTQQSQGYADIWGRLYTAQASSAGSLTITITLTSGIASITACEVRSYSNASSPEKENSVWGTISSASSPYSPLNFGATTAAEQLFLANIICAHTGSPSRTYSANTGWTNEQSIQTSGGGQLIALISKSVTSTGTYDPEWTIDGGSINTVALGLSIVSGSDGAGSPDVTVAASGSAATSGHGTQVPSFSIPL